MGVAEKSVLRYGVMRGEGNISRKVIRVHCGVAPVSAMSAMMRNDLLSYESFLESFAFADATRAEVEWCH